MCALTFDRRFEGTKVSCVMLIPIAVFFVVHIDNIAWGWSYFPGDLSIVVYLKYGHHVWLSVPFSHCNDYGWHVSLSNVLSEVVQSCWSFAKIQPPEECRMADPASFSTVSSIFAAAPMVGLL